MNEAELKIYEALRKIAIELNIDTGALTEATETFIKAYRNQQELEWEAMDYAMATDEQLGEYDVEVQNGDGYYNAEGYFIRYREVD